MGKFKCLEKFTILCITKLCQLKNVDAISEIF